MCCVVVDDFLLFFYYNFIFYYYYYYYYFYLHIIIISPHHRLVEFVNYIIKKESCCGGGGDEERRRVGLVFLIFFIYHRHSPSKCMGLYVCPAYDVPATTMGNDVRYIVLAVLLLIYANAAVSHIRAKCIFTTIHFAPPYVSNQGGWHDVAGAITYDSVHHVFQGTGWNHASSIDLALENCPDGPQAIQENYAGMDSFSTPCSGYVTKDDEGFVCAGFRQCSSKKGVDGGKPWDVPLEVRCATDEITKLKFLLFRSELTVLLFSVQCFVLAPNSLRSCTTLV